MIVDNYVEKLADRLATVLHNVSMRSGLIRTAPAGNGGLGQSEHIEAHGKAVL